MTSFVSFLLFVMTCSLLTQDVSSFILDGQKCLAFPPCTCSGSSVNCYCKRLTTFPKYEVSNFTGTLLNMRMEGNGFTTIPANSFRNLTVSNNTQIYISLENNNLFIVNSNAFLGIGDRIVYLDLRNNMLMSLPTEFGKLSNVRNILLEGNPISSLDRSTMRGLGRSLITFSIDMNYFQSWPVELGLLTSLQELNIRFLDVNHLDFDVFDGFANTLEELEIQMTGLEKVPVALCHLNRLQTFKFTNNNLHVNNTVLEPCAKNLTSVDHVYLYNNNLRYMPNVFSLFPSMYFVSFRSNKLTFIDWDSVPSNERLQCLILAFNDFTRIPSVINKFHALTTFDIQHNKITSIEDSDFNNLSKLRDLYLDGNPIDYISSRAFKNNLALERLYLQHTSLRNLPSSLGGLHNLRNLYLAGSPIQCGCNMEFLKSLNVTPLTMNGTCQSNLLTIKTFLTEDLPKCP